MLPVLAFCCCIDVVVVIVVVVVASSTTLTVGVLLNLLIQCLADLAKSPTDEQIKPRGMTFSGATHHSLTPLPLLSNTITVTFKHHDRPCLTPAVTL
jgi:hypothetical protein